MIVDLILDRKDGFAYDPKEFYDDVTEYASTFGADYMWDIARALDSGTNKDIQKALCNYIDMEDYNPKIKDYINSVNWLEDSNGNFYDSLPKVRYIVLQGYGSNDYLNMSTIFTSTNKQEAISFYNKYKKTKFGKLCKNTRKDYEAIELTTEEWIEDLEDYEMTGNDPIKYDESYSYDEWYRKNSWHL